MILNKIILTLIIITTYSLLSQPISSKNIRLIVLTDIENEPDDAQSMVRLLTYSNHFYIEALIATTSTWMRNEVADWRIKEIISSYGKVKKNLDVHEKGYPDSKYLLSILKKGNPKFGMNGVGNSEDSEGSDFLIDIFEKDDDRPIWISVWGGANVLAQALWKLNRIKTPSEVEDIIDKLRVYTISDQDDSGPWIRKNFPSLFYIVSPGFEENWGGQYHYATWSGISGDNFHGRFDGPDFKIVDNPWLDENIRKNHGKLGNEHPHTEYLMEGDTPSFLGLVQNGLNNPENPNYGGWGGRYEFYIPQFKKYMYYPETRPIWTNAEDEVYSNITKRFHTSNHATIWRWRRAYQHDFAARIDWSNEKKYSDANHPPVPLLNHKNQITAKSGELITLDASSSTDPDNDSLNYRWIYYKEVGTLIRHEIEIKNLDSSKINFIAPEVDEGKTIHFILEVEDDGVPSLTRYQRVIISVLPKI